MERRFSPAVRTVLAVCLLLYYSVWSFAVAALLVVAGSLATPPEPAEKLEGTVYRRKTA